MTHFGRRNWGHTILPRLALCFVSHQLDSIQTLWDWKPFVAPVADSKFPRIAWRHWELTLWITLEETKGVERHDEGVFNRKCGGCDFLTTLKPLPPSFFTKLATCKKSNQPKQPFQMVFCYPGSCDCVGMPQSLSYLNLSQSAFASLSRNSPASGKSPAERLNLACKSSNRSSRLSRISRRFFFLPIKYVKH